VFPSTAVPEIVGGTEFDGGTSAVVSITNCGASCGSASLLLTVRPVVPDPIRATVNNPFPRTKGVTSRLSHCPELNFPDDAVTFAPAAGALLQVIVVSPQLLLATPRTSKPLFELLDVLT